MKAKTKWNKRQIRINRFYKFLLDNDCFHEWRDNVRKSSFNDSITKLFNEKSSVWICYAFHWESTKEGQDYWISIGNKWNKVRTTEEIK